MAKQTLLELVQNILSAMDSDEVNSIHDTVESLQVAVIVKESFDDLTATLDLPERKVLFHLNSLSNTDQANYLSIPENINKIEWVRYNGNVIEYIPPDTFMEYILNTQTGGLITVHDPFQGLAYQVASDRDPKFYTSFDNTNLVFDGVNQATETTLQGQNSMCYGSKTTTITLDDDFVPDLDAHWFPTLLAESKTACFINLKQVSNSKEEVRARRGLVRIQNEISKFSKSPLDRLPNYSRRR